MPATEIPSCLPGCGVLRTQKLKFHLLRTENTEHKDCLFFCVYGVRSLEKEDFPENSHVLSCFVKLNSVLFSLLYVLDLFRNAGSQFCFRFFFLHTNEEEKLYFDFDRGKSSLYLL